MIINGPIILSEASELFLTPLLRYNLYTIKFILCEEFQ